MTLPLKLRILDEVAVAIVGLTKSDHEYFAKKYSVFAPNYFFNPLYKLGRWDGKIRYFSDKGRTYLYLLEEILPVLIKSGYNITVEDLRPNVPNTPSLIDDQMFNHILHLDTGKPTIMRDYQVRGINSLIAHGNGILVASTGAGKTLLCAALVNAYGLKGYKTLTIVPSQDLIIQTKTDYINCKLDTGEYSGAHKTLEHQHIVSTWQALNRNPHLVEMFQVVLVDECHGAKGSVLQKILTEHSAQIPFRFGVTGTLPKEEADTMSCHVALGPVRETVTAAELMDRGILAQLHIDVLQLEEDLTKEYASFCENDHPLSKPPTYTQFKDGYFPDFTSEKSFLYHNTGRVEWIADFLLAKQDMKKGNTMCFVDNIQFGRKLTSLIPGSIFVNGQDMKKPAKRKEVYDLFKHRDDLIVIATVNIAGTGLNIKRIFNLVTIDVGKSFIRVIQAIGRGLRTDVDKDSVDMTDICSDLKYSKKHLKMRTNYYTEAQYKFKKHKINYRQMMQSPTDID